MIIAVKEKDRVVIGFSATDRMYASDMDFVDEENIAVKVSNSGKVFGFATMDTCSDSLLYDDEFMNLEIAPKAIIKDVIPYIKFELKELNKPLDEDGGWRNALVLCDDEHIYDIDTKFGFCEVDDYVCHGYEVETAKSVLDATVSLPAEERIIKAMTFIGKTNKVNLFPMVIIDTKSKKFKNIYEGEKDSEHTNRV